MDVDSDDEQDAQEATPLLPREAFLHNRADRLKEDGGTSPAGNVSHVWQLFERGVILHGGLFEFGTRLK